MGASFSYFFLTVKKCINSTHAASQVIPMPKNENDTFMVTLTLYLEEQSPILFYCFLLTGLNCIKKEKIT